MSDEPKRKQGYAGSFGLGVAFVVGAIVGGCAMTVLTAIGVQRSSRHKQYEHERDAVAPAIAKDPAFKHVEFDEESIGGIWITGEVLTTADKKRLQELVIRALGERRAEDVMHVHARDEHN
jgi:hypothetical protein